jgi:hypothetical protein
MSEKDLENIPEQQQPEPMEVHHHAHHDHGKKNWKSYFWEFLMLFLAVFCGFMAEYQLEHKIEKDREVQYIESLIQNLKTDTAALTTSINSNFRKEAAWASLLKLAKENLSDSANARKFYTDFIKGGFSPFFRPTDATIIQLKNSGNLRLIRNKEVVDSILEYDFRNRIILDHNETFNNHHNSLWESAYSVMQGWIMADTAYVDFTKREIKSSQVPPLNNDKLSKQIFFGSLARGILFTRVNRNYLIQQKVRAQKLITFLQSKYKLKS